MADDAVAGGDDEETGSDDLVRVLERSRALGFLGPGPVQPQIGHALQFWNALAADWGDADGAMVADLGAGGGLPSLPLLVAHRDLRMVLVDAIQKRASFLVWATIELGLAERAEVWCGRAEDFGHVPARRGRFDAVMARGFGPPSSTLECGAPLLRPGGRLVVSEPPAYRRYAAAGLARCGLTLVAQRDGCAVFELVGEVDPAFPRPAVRQQRDPVLDDEM
ncbi:MAG: RsmG family class I SAM-dependent methyltransferase [Acidimicrobiales bacterium]